MKHLWTEDHLPTKLSLNWPIHRDYKITSLSEYIKVKSEQKAGTITSEQWEAIEQVTGDSGDPNDNTLERLHLVHLNDHKIHKYCDLFSDFSETIIEDFSAIGVERSSSHCLELIYAFLKKYGAPFALDCPSPNIDCIPQSAFDDVTYGARTIENILYDAFHEKVIMTGHIIWRSKEIYLMQTLFVHYAKTDLDLDKLLKSKYLFPEGIDITDANLYSTAIDLLHQRTSEHISRCKITLKREEVPSASTAISALKPYIEPLDLLTGLWLKINHRLLVNGPITTCDECGRPFKKTRDWSRYCPGPCGARARQREHRKNK